MISLILLLIILRYYWRLAKKIGQNPYLWAFLAFSIYAILASGLMFLFVYLLEVDLNVSTKSETSIKLIASLLSLIWTYLMAPLLLKKKVLTTKDDILDADL